MEPLNTQKQLEFKGTDIISLKKSVQMKSKAIASKPKNLKAASSVTNKGINEQSLVIGIPKTSIENTLEKRFGWFNCGDCKRGWTSRSVFCYRGTNEVFIQQTCNRCNNVVVPHKVKEFGKKLALKKFKPTRKAEKENEANVKVKPIKVSGIADKIADVTDKMIMVCAVCEEEKVAKKSEKVYSEVELERTDKVDSSSSNNGGVKGEVTSKGRPRIPVEFLPSSKAPEQMTDSIAAAELTNEDGSEKTTVPSTIGSNGVSPGCFISDVSNCQDSEGGNKGENCPMETNKGSSDDTEDKKNDDGSGRDGDDEEGRKESNDDGKEGDDNQSDRGEDKDGEDKDGDGGKDEDGNDDDSGKNKDGEDEEDGDDKDGDDKDGDDKDGDDKDGKEIEKVDGKGDDADTDQSQNKSVEEVEDKKQVNMDDQNKDQVKPSKDAAGSITSGDGDSEGISDKPGNQEIGTSL